MSTRPGKWTRLIAWLIRPAVKQIIADEAPSATAQVQIPEAALVQRIKGPSPTRAALLDLARKL